MRQFSLVGLALVLLAGGASAQDTVHVRTIRDGRGKTTFIERVPAVGVPTLDQLGAVAGPCCPPACCPSYALQCLLGDQPALLNQICLLDASMACYVGALRMGFDNLPRPAALDDKKPADKKPDDKKADEKRADNKLGSSAMQNMDLKNWGDMGRSFVDAGGRRWSLLRGCPLGDPGLRLRGWLLESDGKKLYFLDNFGNLYTNTAGPLP